MIALSGVRSSCDMLARNSLLCRLAVSSSRLLISISRNSRAFWMAMRGLRRERLQELDHLRIEVARGLAIHDRPPSR